MKLSLEILKRRLEDVFPVTAYGEPQASLDFGRPVLYYEGCKVSQGNLYIVDTGALGAGNWDGCALICVSEEKSEPAPTDTPLLIVESTHPEKAINAVNEAFDFYADWDMSLALASKTENADINGMLAASVPVFGNIIMLMNMNFKFEYSSDPAYDSIAYIGPRLDDDGFIPSAVVQYFKTNQEYIESKESREPYIQPKGILPYRSMCLNLFWDDNLIGRIVVNELTRTFHETDLVLLKHLASYIRAVYINSLRTRSHPVFELKDAIARALDGRDPGASDMIAIIDKHGWSRDDQYICLWLVSKDSISSAERHYGCREIEKQCKGACALEYEENIVALVNLTHNGNQTGHVMKWFGSLAMESYYKIGASMAFCDAANLIWHYLQARAALETGLNVNPSGQVFSFDDYRARYMLSKCGVEILPEFSCHPDLLRLRQIDAETGSDYFLTLRSYLRNCRHTTCASDELFIHRLTMNYRLNKIKETTALKWEGPEDYFELLLSFFLLEYNQARL